MLSNQSLLRFIDTDQSFGKKCKDDKNDSYYKFYLFSKACRLTLLIGSLFCNVLKDWSKKI